MSSAEATVRMTPLYETHVAAGARMVPFAGWSMPIQYEGVMAEHNAVRSSAGVFDVSHMGQVMISGENVREHLQHVLSNDLNKLELGEAHYTLLTNVNGGVIDDLIVYRMSESSYLLVVNAANRQVDVEHLNFELANTLTVDDISDTWSMLAVQGSKALKHVANILRDEYVTLRRPGYSNAVDIESLAPFQIVSGSNSSFELNIATTGYTGERGCEILVPNESAAWLWSRLVKDEGVTPCGLGARDTLRLEVCYPLHGHELTAATSPIGAGLGWVCSPNVEYIGSDQIAAHRANGTAQKLVALMMTEPGIPRAECPVMLNGSPIGKVSSGTMSPTLGIGIALAWVDSAHSSINTDLQIDIRGKMRNAQITKKPFYTAAKEPTK